MSQGILTNAGRSLLAESDGASERLVIDRFVFANVPGLDIGAPANPDEVVPIDHVVHEMALTQSGYVTPDKVVYSVFLGTDIGDFTFNWVGLLSENDTLVAVRYIDPVNKIRTQGTRLGNAMTRNFMITYLDVTNITGITINADTWQLQFDQATEEYAGNIEVATQAETNAGISDTRAITPAKLAASLINSLNSDSTSRGLSAAQGRALKNLIDQLTLDVENHRHNASHITAGVLNRARLPDATASLKGISRFASESEANAMESNQAALTPAALGTFSIDSFNSSSKTRPLSANGGRQLKQNIDQLVSEQPWMPEGFSFWRDRHTGFQVVWGTGVINANTRSSLFFQQSFSSCFTVTVNPVLNDQISNFPSAWCIEEFNTNSVRIYNDDDFDTTFTYIAIGIGNNAA